jgi:hypothetical protein
MQFSRLPKTSGFALVALLAGLLLTAAESRSSLDVQPAADSFTPVAPAAAIRAAFQTNLKITHDWLDQKDFLSTADSVQSLLALAQLWTYQSNQPAWRDQAAALREGFTRLAAAARAKDMAGCQKALQQCDTLLEEMAKGPPPGGRAFEKSFKPAAPLRHWMLLMEGAYADAKTAKSVPELENLAYLIAEGANASQYLRPDAAWRKRAVEVRETALAMAKQAHDEGLGPARQALKGVFQRCEACHQDAKR